MPVFVPVSKAQGTVHECMERGMSFARCGQAMGRKDSYTVDEGDNLKLVTCPNCLDLQLKRATVGGFQQPRSRPRRVWDNTMGSYVSEPPTAAPATQPNPPTTPNPVTTPAPLPSTTLADIKRQVKEKDAEIAANAGDDGNTCQLPLLAAGAPATSVMTPATVTPAPAAPQSTTPSPTPSYVNQGTHRTYTPPPRRRWERPLFGPAEAAFNAAKLPTNAEA